MDVVHVEIDFGEIGEVADGGRDWEGEVLVLKNDFSDGSIGGAFDSRPGAVVSIRLCRPVGEGRWVSPF